MESFEFKIDLEACPTPIIIVESSGTIVSANRRFEKLFGYGRGELVGELVEVLVPEEFRSYHPDLRTAFFEVPTTRRMGTGRDLHGVRKNGDKIPVEIGLEPVSFGEDDMVMVSVLDIRQRKEGEAMIRRALDAASSAMIQVGEKGTIELVNGKAVELFGYEPEELIGTSIENLIPERYRRKHRVYRASYENSSKRRSMGYGRTLFGLRKNGTEFPVEIGLTPVEEGGVRSTMATINDITERLVRDRRLSEKTAQLQRVNQELLEFAYSASHDLKAPLVAVAGLLEYCEKDVDAGDLEEVKSNLRRSKGLVSRLSERVESMLTLAKSDSLEENWEDLDVEAVVESTWGALEANGVRLERSFEHQGPLRTVSVRFSVILENLLSNAIKYRDPDRDDATVVVRTWLEGSEFNLAVQDNGIGIPAQFQSRVFDLFRRMSDSEQPGSGLGLALVRKNVQQLGGSVELESEKGNTVFRVKLPGHRGNLETGE